jgi:parallel beta-helix repeat protein
VRIDSSKAAVQNNVIKNGEAGIAINKASGECTVSNNKVTNVRMNSIYVVNTTNGKVKIGSNTVKKSKGAGIRIDKSKKVTVSKNEVRDCHFGFSLSEASNITISNNKASGGSVVVRVVDKCKNVTVKKNTLKAKKGKVCKDYAIYYYDHCTGKVLNNKIVKPGIAGVRVDKNCKVKIKGNKVKSPGKKAYAIS